MSYAYRIKSFFQSWYARIQQRTGHSPLYLLVLLLSVGGTYVPTVRWLINRWRLDPFYSHGFLVPLVTAWILWKRRSTIFRAGRSCRYGWVLIGTALPLHGLGIRLSFYFLSATALILTLHGLVLLLLGKNAWRSAAFPLFFLFFLLPLPRFVINKISVPLQQLSASGSVALFDLFNIPLSRSGLQLEFPGFIFAIQDACSGFRSVITVAAISSLIAFLTPTTNTARVLMVFLGEVLALCSNIFRIFISGCIGLVFGGDLALRFFETGSGVLFFALVILSMLGLSVMAPRDSDAQTSAPSSSPSSSPEKPLRGSTYKLLFTFFLVAAPGTFLLLPSRTQEPPQPKNPIKWKQLFPEKQVKEYDISHQLPGESMRGIQLVQQNQPAVQGALLFNRDARNIHSPGVCMTSGGWTINQKQKLRLNPVQSDPFSINLWTIQRKKQEVLVAFGYISGRTLLTSSVQHHLKILYQRLLYGSSESMYFEIAVPLSEEHERSEALNTLRTVVRRAVPKLLNVGRTN